MCELFLQTLRHLAQVSIPDKTAAELLGGQPGGLLSMCAGDFVEVRGMFARVMARARARARVRARV